MKSDSQTAGAFNFNPNHDELGRFTTGDGVAGQSGLEASGQGPHLNYTGEPTQQKGNGAVAQGTISSISGYGFGSKSLATCVIATIQSMIATKYRTRNVPGEEAIKAQITVAAKGIFTDTHEVVDWTNFGVRAFPEHLAEIMQKVLAVNGVQTTAQSGYGSAKELAAAIIASKQPVAINLQRAGTKEQEQHSVAVQWSPNAAGAGQGRFLMNNVTTKGETQGFTREQFEQGQITANIREKDSIRTPKMMYYHIQYKSGAVFTKDP